MSDEARDIAAALFGKPSTAGDEDASGSPEPDADQAELARRYSLSADDAKRVRGDTWAERCEDAERLSGLAEAQPIRERARQHLREMQDNPNVGELALLAQARLKNQGLLELLGAQPEDGTEGG